MLPAFVKLYPTPTAGCVEGGEQSNRVEQTKNGGFILRKKNKPNMTFGAKLSDAMLYLEKQKTLPTPTAANKGKMFLVKKTTASHNVTINAGDGSVLIDDQTSITDNAKNGFDQVVSDGTQYWIISEG